METKACTKCGEIKPLEAFHKAIRGMNGYCSQCKDCRKKQWNERHKGNPRAQTQQSKESRQRWNASNPIARKAHNALHNAIRYNRIPRASALACAECSNQAKHYHHHLGYDPEHWFDVIPLC